MVSPLPDTPESLPEQDMQYLYTYETHYRLGGQEFTGTVTARSRAAAMCMLRSTGFRVGRQIKAGWYSMEIDYTPKRGRPPGR